jgi:hypothetical protein
MGVSAAVVDQIYKRYCAGDKIAGKIVCQGDNCLIIVTS